METTLRPNLSNTLVGPAGGAAAPGTTALVRTSAADIKATEPKAPQRELAAQPPARRGQVRWDRQLQGDVASAQQAQAYLERVAAQLESVKAALSAKLAGLKSGARELEARAHQLGSTVAARSAQAGGSLDANLHFTDGAPAQQRFRIQGLDAATLQAAAPLSLSFSIGAAGGPHLSASFEPEMSAGQIAERLDRTLAPLNVRAGLDREGRIAFSTAEANWPAVRDSIAISGRGRAGTEAIPPELKLQDLDKGDADALRQNLREVVQALERVRRSQSATSAALNAATARVAQSEVEAADLVVNAQDFTTTAASHDYESLLAITSALVGVSRERVLALLGLR